jgi:hypothetical protein
MACQSCQNKKKLWANAWSFLNKFVQLEANGEWFKVVSIQSTDGPIKRIGLYMGEEENLQWVLPNSVHDVRDVIQN